MEIYPTLSLRHGGGIISPKQQAEQVENAVNIFIGLGGTGVDCIKTIKAAVRERLLPDDPEAAVPGYSHIRFLGVDVQGTKQISGKKKSGICGSPEKMDVLEEEEIFSLWNPHLRQDISCPRAIEMRPEFKWLNYRELQYHEFDSDDSLSFYRCRQLNRFCFIDKSDKFSDKLELLLEEAGKGLKNPHIYIHVFTGLSGSTGAGIFLDVCYLVREILKERYGIIFGYFFLPDVNLSRISLENRLVRAYIPRFAYAAMKELDYCMRIHENGGAFTQTYKGGRKIPWAEPPVTFPFVIAGTREDGTSLPHAYEYALNLVCEYILFHLIKKKDSNFYDLSDYVKMWSGNLDAVKQGIEAGVCVKYLTLGGSCARIPYREMNTCLMAEIFQKISDRTGEIFDKTLKDKKIAGEDRERLWKVLANLQETFLDNLKILEEAEKKLPKEMEFFYDLITVEEMKPEMEKELAKIQPEKVLVKLLDRLLKEENREALEDEERIAGVFNHFFTEEVFPEFADLSVEGLLRKKYKINNQYVLANELYKEVMKSMVKNSIPFFSVNPQVWDRSKIARGGTIAVPESVSALLAAQKTYYEYSLLYSPEVRMKDRILLWGYAYGFPLGAYLKCPEYEMAYYSCISEGLHSYEGRGECLFNDWRKLPSLIPLSCRKIR